MSRSTLEKSPSNAERGYGNWLFLGMPSVPLVGAVSIRGAMKQGHPEFRSEQEAKSGNCSSSTKQARRQMGVT